MKPNEMLFRSYWPQFKTLNIYEPVFSCYATNSFNFHLNTFLVHILTCNIVHAQIFHFPWSNIIINSTKKVYLI